MKTRIETQEILSRVKLPHYLKSLNDWRVASEDLESQLLYSFPQNLDRSTLIAEIAEALETRGFVLEHAERQDSHYRSGDIRISVAITTLTIENISQREQRAEEVVVFW